MNDPARASADSGTGTFPPGTLLGGRFRIKEFVRVEGETQVYRASDAHSGSEVALRTVSLAGAGRAALERDLAKAQQVSHKNLTALLGCASQGQLLLVASELEPGHNLRQVIDAQRAQGQTVGAERAYTL